MPIKDHKAVLIALVVCDNIYKEASGKAALVGLFNSISAAHFPFTHARIAVFVSITDAEPRSRGKLELVHSETEEAVITAEGELPGGRTDLVDMEFLLNGVTFREPGLYFMRFHVNGHILGMRPFHVRQSQSSVEERTKDE